jgi:hypothetical protein
MIMAAAVTRKCLAMRLSLTWGLITSATGACHKLIQLQARVQGDGMRYSQNRWPQAVAIACFLAGSSCQHPLQHRDMCLQAAPVGIIVCQAHVVGLLLMAFP